MIEVVVGVGLFTLITLAVFAFQQDFFTLNRLVSGGLTREFEIRRVFKNFGAEVRAAVPSSLGGYTIEQAAAGTFVFFADIDGDGLKERIRYFGSGNALNKGVLKPSGNPLAYNPANETTSQLVRDVTAPSAIFSYFDSSYDGTGSPLGEPIDVSLIRLVRLTLSVDPNGAKPPGPATFTVQSAIRNLRSQ